jgi:hypothetical protein
MVGGGSPQERRTSTLNLITYLGGKHGERKIISPQFMQPIMR